MAADQDVAGEQKAAPRILVVDDEEPIRRVLSRILERNGYRCFPAQNAETAKERLAAEPFDVLLTDMDLPGESGLDLLTLAATQHPDMAAVMVTGLDDRHLVDSALDLGAYGYIIKPFEPSEVIINVANALRRRTLEIENRSHQRRLESMVKERTAELWKAVASLERTEQELRRSREETIERLSIAAEFRDDETARHVQRMGRYCALIAKNLGVDSERCELLRVASQMHDVGKIGIPDNILLKPGSLTPEERGLMQRHPEIGFRILSGSKSDLLELAAEIALTHHEKVDGSGYPKGLVGDEIPFEGRVAAVADVFDALTSNRVYKKAFPLGKALDVMKAGAGSHFDTEMLSIFMDNMDSVLTIKADFADL